MQPLDTTSTRAAATAVTARPSPAPPVVRLKPPLLSRNRILSGRVPGPVYEAVMRRVAGRCEVCGRRARTLQWHHRLTVADGGPHTVVNGLAVHPGCHADRIHSRPRQALTNGWLVARGKSPAHTAVLLHGTRRATLTEDGHYESVSSTGRPPAAARAPQVGADEHR